MWALGSPFLLFDFTLGRLSLGFLLWLSWQTSRLQCGRPGFNGLGRFPWRRERLPTPVFWTREFHGLYMGHKESDTTERFSLHFRLSLCNGKCPPATPGLWFFQLSFPVSVGFLFPKGFSESLELTLIESGLCMCSPLNHSLGLERRTRLKSPSKLEGGISFTQTALVSTGRGRRRDSTQEN